MVIQGTEMDGKPNSEKGKLSLPLSLPLSQYPDTDNPAEWDKIFPYKQSKHLTELLNNRNAIIEQLKLLENPEGPARQKLKSLQRESESIAASEIELEDVKSATGFFDSALTIAQDNVNMRRGNRDLLKAILENDWGNMFLRSSIVDAAVESSLGNSVKFTDLRKALVHLETARDKAAKDASIKSYEDSLKQYEMRILSLKIEKISVDSEIETQKEKDEVTRQGQIRETILNVTREREAEVERLKSVQEGLNKIQKIKKEQELVRSLSSSGDNRLEPLDLDDVPEFESQPVRVKHEENTGRYDDISDIMLKNFQEENKRGRVQVREERRRRRSDRAKRRANGEKNVSEDEPYDSGVDGLFSDEEPIHFETSDVESEDRQSGKNNPEKPNKESSSTYENSENSEDQNKKMRELERSLFYEDEDEDEDDNGAHKRVKQENQNVQIPLSGSKSPFSGVDTNGQNLANQHINERANNHSHELTKRTQFPNTSIHQYDETHKVQTVPFAEYSKNRANEPSQFSHSRNNHNNYKQQNKGLASKPNQRPKEPSSGSATMGPNLNTLIPKNLFITKPTDPRKRPRK